MNIAGTVLYVADVSKSVAFYRDLFVLEPSYYGEGFALFELESGQLRLWQQDEVVPTVSSSHSVGLKDGCELAFNLGEENALDNLFDKLSTMAEILQLPCQMSFGKAFTALDPDGHRLRFMHVEVAASN